VYELYEWEYKLGQVRKLRHKAEDMLTSGYFDADTELKYRLRLALINLNHLLGKQKHDDYIQGIKLIAQQLKGELD